MRPFLIAAILFVSAGCGRSNIAPVAGTVTMDDKPLAFAVVTFQPISKEDKPGPGSIGRTDAKGHFTLQLMSNDAKGAVVGKHKVVITAYEGDTENESSAPTAVIRKALVPTKYNAESNLNFDVPAGGTTQADFHLKSK